MNKKTFDLSEFPFELEGASFRLKYHGNRTERVTSIQQYRLEMRDKEGQFTPVPLVQRLVIELDANDPIPRITLELVDNPKGIF